MSNEVNVILPSGCWIDGECFREARIRLLPGDDEAFLYEIGNGFLPAQWTTAILARCLAGIGPRHDVDEDLIRSLCAGDREALLLHLRRLMFGERMQCTLVCPNRDCGETMEIELSTSSLILSPYPCELRYHEAVFEDGGQSWRVRFRLPTGSDQEAAAGLALVDDEAAADLFLRSCILEISNGEGRSVEKISPRLASLISQAMAYLDPQSELRLDLVCPFCNGRYSTIFDTAGYLSQELAMRSEHIYREVHTIAIHYHWSEHEILGLSPGRRRRYLDLIEEERERR
ncbi:MAG: hypothetical protein NTY37_13050 [Methanothrix sp.]|nr:hypothetical protein [Methanothrix sp.]